jgi:DNA modification methylase
VIYRWYKYKEAFSASLVEHLLRKYDVMAGRLLDPFAGSGTALFAASELGMEAEGIELLPIGQQVIATRLCLESEFPDEDFAALRRWLATRPWKDTSARGSLLELRISSGAYPKQTVEAIERYTGAWQAENERVRLVLRFALLCVLESISYTRKDGQYLRWDYRSGRRQGTRPFDKGPILDFDEAICAKLDEITHDLQNGDERAELFPAEHLRGRIRLHEGSCLDVMPRLPGNSFDVIVTSPPYCNRYDYTRTYALELALLGVEEQGLIDLRQRMLSCTVENRAKDLLSMNSRWADALAAADRQELLQAILHYLEAQKSQGALNNNGIPRMVRGYFYEMACVILECARALKSNAPLFMVNDNVRYAGASISVDMILSEIAEQLGFRTERILVLPNGKGNSSQQMGKHGRDALRKCVYVWRKI